MKKQFVALWKDLIMNEPGSVARTLLQGLASLALLSGIAVTVNASEAPPNFVIIFTDDQGYQDLGCFGSPEIPPLPGTPGSHGSAP